MGTTKVGDFDVELQVAEQMLPAPNPHNRPNSDVLRPFRNGSDLVRRNAERWIVDFGVGTSIETAAMYELPFKHVCDHVRPEREQNNDKWRRTHWWLLGRTLPEFRAAVRPLRRYLATPRVSKHRVFVWQDAIVLPDSKVIAIALDGDFHFGVLHSRIHEVWTLATCAWHGKGNDPTVQSDGVLRDIPVSRA